MKKILLATVMFLVMFSYVIPLSFAQESDEYTICPEETGDACAAYVAPVCGDDGEQYSNDCYACQAENVTKYKDGECENETNTTITNDEEVDENETNVTVTDEEVEATEDSEEDNDASIIVYPLGAKVRLIQLEIGLTKAVIAGNVINGYLEDNYVDTDLERMNEIVNELQDMLEEIAAMRQLDEPREDSVEKFVEYKDTSKDLIKEYRDLVKEILSTEDYSAVRELVRNADYSEIESLRQQQKELVREYNANRVQKFLERFQRNNPDLIRKVKNGEFNAAQIKNQMREAIKSIDRTKIKEAVQRISEARKQLEKAKIEAKKARVEVEKIRERAQEMREKFKNNRQEAIDARRANFREITEKRKAQPVRGGN